MAATIVSDKEKQAILQRADTKSLRLFVCLFACVFLDNCICVVAWLFVILCLFVPAFLVSLFFVYLCPINVKILMQISEQFKKR